MAQASRRIRRAVASAGILLLSAPSWAQGQINPDTVSPPADYDNVAVKTIHSDSLSTVFVIWVKKEVKAHYHARHSEQVLILDGRANMRVGDSTIHVRKGDLISIPAGTVHSVTVTSRKPLKVLSIQSPEFLGDDRILVE